MAPFARVAGELFYAHSRGLELLERHLQIAPTDKGENVTIFKADDDGLWLETMDLSSNTRATGPIQTYLDGRVGRYCYGYCQKKGMSTDARRLQKTKNPHQH